MFETFSRRIRNCTLQRKKTFQVQFHLVETKILESKFSGKTNLDKLLHDNIRKVQDSAFYPQGVMAHSPRQS